MPTSADILSLAEHDRAGVVPLKRRMLHRFLVGFMVSRQLRPSPHLRALLVAAIDSHPGPAPFRRADLESHLDAVLRARGLQPVPVASKAVHS